MLVTLLRDNPANQLMFRESGHLSNVPLLLKLPADGPSAQQSGYLGQAVQSFEAQLAGPPGASTPALPAEVAANVCSAAELVRALLCPISVAAMQPEACGGAEAAQAKHSMAKQCLEANHALLLKSKLQGALLDLALLQGQGPACSVRVAALQALQSMLAGRQPAQDAFVNATVAARGAQTPAIQVGIP